MKYAVVDVETTGFGKADRVVEIAVVVIDAASGEVVDEFDTLVNPERDIGATNVHGITASMVESAPTFDEVAGPISRVIGGNVLVAHNLPFDQRFIRQEFDRLAIGFEPGRGLCTLRLTNERLSVACERHGIEIGHHHRALSDARATARLLTVVERPDDVAPARLLADLSPGVPRTLRRDSVGGAALPIAPSRFRVRYPTTDELAASYLHVLDAYLDDLVLEEQERSDLADLAALYGIGAPQREALHEAYVEALIAAALRDGVITPGERTLIDAICRALDLDPVRVPDVTEVPRLTNLDGARVCFTGTFVVAGVEMTKEKLAAIAAKAGLQPVGDVTKKGCDLLVAADPATSSGKAAKARSFGIPVMGIGEFMAEIDSRLA